MIFLIPQNNFDGTIYILRPTSTPIIIAFQISTRMLPSAQPDQAYMDVSALEGGSMQLCLQIFVEGATASDIVTCPSLAFLLTHSKSKSRIMFDLGCRRDVGSHSPLARAFIEKWTPITVPQDVIESLAMGGVHPEDIESVIISHLHYDQ